MTRKMFDGPSIASSEITPESVWLNRRNLMKAAATGAVAGGLPALALSQPRELAQLAAKKGDCSGCQAEDDLTPYEDATTYNNFYEFGTDKGDPVEHAHEMTVDPWSVEVSGHGQH